MKKQIFRKDDRVFDVRYGWGIVQFINNLDSFPLYVKFENGYAKYTIDGKNSTKSIAPELSFTRYENGGKLSQERPVNYEDCIGKWGEFWNDYGDKIIDRLLYIKDEEFEQLRFKAYKANEYYSYFEPLTEKEIKVLGLKNN